MFKDWWLRFGCFITGYNYKIVKVCSEVTAKEVKRYASALLIICILWAFVGFTFADRYLKAGLFGSIIGALILVTIIIQVERQIILSIHPSKLLYISRGIIAVTMSLIGSIIIDQIILKEDIDLKKTMMVDEKVNKRMPSKSMELRAQIAQLDSVLQVKEQERSRLQADIVANPTIVTVTTSTTPIVLTNTTVDSNNTRRTTQSTTNAQVVTRNAIANPNIKLVENLDAVIGQLRTDKQAKDSALVQLRPNMEKEILASKGFLDELEVMIRLISESGVALFIWLLWVIIILGIELFVLISKIGEKTTDYHAMVDHQMQMHLHKLRLLEPKEGLPSRVPLKLE
jgi:cell division protein FtsB